jgi:hypothetical protein
MAWLTSGVWPVILKITPSRTGRHSTVRPNSAATVSMRCAPR